MMIFSSGVGITILIVFVCVFGIGGLSILFFFLGKKLWMTYQEKNNKLIDSAITKTEMMKDINAYIKKNQRFGSASFIYIDLDSFHSFIDVYGQKTCEDALKIIAKRIANLLPHEAKIANVNKDDFLIFIKEENNSIHNDNLCKKILDNVREPINIFEEEGIGADPDAEPFDTQTNLNEVPLTEMFDEGEVTVEEVVENDKNN